MLSNLELMRRIPLFATLTEAQASLMSNAVVKRRFKRGETLVEQGKKNDALFIILNGRVRVLATDENEREVILATLRAGDFIGEMSLIDHQPHSATVRADTQADVLVLGRDAFQRSLPENMAMALALMKGLATRLRQANRKIESLALMDVYGRVARALLDLGAPDADGDWLIKDRVSRQDLAKMIGASREMVSRVMRDLEERGVVQTLENGHMRIRENLTVLS